MRTQGDYNRNVGCNPKPHSTKSSLPQLSLKFNGIEKGEYTFVFDGFIFFFQYYKNELFVFIFSIVPPEIGEGPELVAASVNTQSVLPCEGSGTPTPAVSWMKNGKPFPSSGMIAICVFIFTVCGLWLLQTLSVSVCLCVCVSVPLLRLISRLLWVGFLSNLVKTLKLWSD